VPLLRRIAPVRLWLADWRRFPGLSPSPPLSALNLTVPQTLTGQLTAMLSVHFRPAVERLAEVCKLPLTLSVSQDPPKRRSPHSGTPSSQPSNCFGAALSHGLATVSESSRSRSSGVELLDLAVSVGSDVVSDDWPSRAHTSRLATCSGLQATPDPFGGSEPPGRHSPLPGSPVTLHRRNCSGLVLACGLATVFRALTLSSTVKLSTSRFHKLGRDR